MFSYCYVYRYITKRRDSWREARQNLNAAVSSSVGGVYCTQSGYLHVYLQSTGISTGLWQPTANRPAGSTGLTNKTHINARLVCTLFLVFFVLNLLILKLDNDFLNRNHQKKPPKVIPQLTQRVNICFSV